MQNKVTKTEPKQNGKKVIVLTDSGIVTDAIRNKTFGWEQRRSGYSLTVETPDDKVIAWAPYPYSSRQK